jgi:hypothetical protein
MAPSARCRSSLPGKLSKTKRAATPQRGGRSFLLPDLLQKSFAHGSRGVVFVTLPAKLTGTLARGFAHLG